ncbi:MAG: hypothetical protein AB7O37_09320 [Vicinamibacteria bacterium]
MARSWDTALPTLAVSVLAALLVPPSSLLPGISDVERQLVTAILPLLLGAVALASAATVSSFGGRHRLVGLFGVLSLLLVNGAGLLSGQYGTDGIGVLVTLVVTSPIAIVMALRESAFRRGRG